MLENSVGLCQVWSFAQSLRLGEEVEQKPLFWLKKSKKMQIWNSCVCRRQSEEQRSEVFPLKRKLWQASVHPWHGLLLIYCASVLCVGWKASSFLWLAASFLSHIFFFFFCPLFTCTTSQRGFWPECTEKHFLEMDIFLLMWAPLFPKVKMFDIAPIFLRNMNKSAQWGYRAQRWGQSGNEGVGFLVKEETWGSGTTGGFLSLHLPPTLGLKSWVTSFQMFLRGWCPIALGIEPLAHKNACVLQCSRGQFSRRQRDAEKSGTVTPHIPSQRACVKWPRSTMDCTVTDQKFAGKEQRCWLAK